MTEQLPNEPRRTVTTTNDPPADGGHPRLVFAADSDSLDGRRSFLLLGPVTSIGSGARCDITLPELHEQHAQIRHNPDDEYVLLSEHPDQTRVHGEPTERRVLRTGARIDLGQTTLIFVRDEHSDHGRPYAGRSGGEAGHQHSQPEPPRRDG